MAEIFEIGSTDSNMLENASQLIAVVFKHPIAGVQHRSVWLGLNMVVTSASGWEGGRGATPI